MDMSRFLPGLNKRESELTDGERAFVKADAPKHGPTRMRTVSAGQQRRAEARYRKAQSRKATKRHRREFHQTQMAIAVLRGQLQTVASEPLHNGRYMVGQDVGLMEHVHNTLVETYGSVDAAQAAYDALIGRKAAA